MTESERAALRERAASLLEFLNEGEGPSGQYAAPLVLLAFLSGENILFAGINSTEYLELVRRAAGMFVDSSFMTEVLTPGSTVHRVYADGFGTATAAFLSNFDGASEEVKERLLNILLQRDPRESGGVRITTLAAASRSPKGSPSLPPLFESAFSLRVDASSGMTGDNFLFGVESSDVRNLSALETKISSSEMDGWRAGIHDIKLSRFLRAALSMMRNELNTVTSGSGPGAVPDERWRRLARLAQAGAYFSGRDTAGLSDLMLLKNSLWRMPEEVPFADDLVDRAAGSVIGDIDTALEETKKTIDRLEDYTDLIGRALMPENGLRLRVRKGTVYCAEPDADSWFELRAAVRQGLEGEELPVYSASLEPTGGKSLLGMMAHYLSTDEAREFAERLPKVLSEIRILQKTVRPDAGGFEEELRQELAALDRDLFLRRPDEAKLRKLLSSRLETIDAAAEGIRDVLERMGDAEKRFVSL